MKTIGLIGGMSWESSLEYYRLLNEKTRTINGGLGSAQFLMYSVDFSEIAKLQHSQKWDELGVIMREAAKRLEKGGADIIALCTNTMYILSAEIVAATSIPFIHIANATGSKVNASGLSSVLLLGTQFTMEKSFYKKTLADEFGINCVVPELRDRQEVHRIIYEELVIGRFLDSSRQWLIELIENAQVEGAEGVVLGCTELPLLIKERDVTVPLFPTTETHVDELLKVAFE